MGGLLENRVLASLVSRFTRSPRQINLLMESDSELLRLDKKGILAATTDCIVEEIEAGLYDDPYLIGWMAVVVNLSDLAAVGAEPLGVLLQQTIPRDYPDRQLGALQNGIRDACRAHHTFVLGGDTNFSENLTIGGVALGYIEDKPLITRVGCRENDLLYLSGNMGLGNAYAFSRLFRNTASEINYLPHARLAEGQVIRQFGTCCIDTSDGFFPALCNLMERNGSGFRLTLELSAILHPDSLQLARAARIPPWFFLAGPHGEFELLFTVPETRQKAFLAAAGAISWQPVAIGKVVREEEFSFPMKNKTKHIDPFAIANLFTECNGNPEKYLQMLIKKNEQWQMKT